MKNYMVLMSQGGGCDYTIGCGIAYEIIEASSPEEAFSKWADSREMNLENEPDIAKHFFPGGEGELEEVMVLDLGPNFVTNDHLWPEFVAEKQQEQKATAIAADKARELAEFERLKKKLGK